MEKAPQGCSNPKEDSDDEQAHRTPTKAPKKLKVIDPICFKCKQRATYNYKNGIVVCSNCFKTTIVEHRFKSNLRKYVGVHGKNKNNFCVLLSGGASSMCLSKIVSES